MPKKNCSSKKTLKRSNGYIIKLKPRYAVKGFYIILNSGQSCALPNNTYIVDKNQLDQLEKHKIKYNEIKKPDLNI